MTSAASPSPVASSAPVRPAPQPRSAYRVFRPITTRWADNDVYAVSYTHLTLPTNREV